MSKTIYSRLVTSLTKLSDYASDAYEVFSLSKTIYSRSLTSLRKLSDYASHAYEFFSNYTSSAEKERAHHQDSDSDKDDFSLLLRHGNKKMPPFYPPIQGRYEYSPVIDSLNANILE